MSEQNATFEATIWENYSKYYVLMEEWAVCKYCKKLVGSSKEGITYLENHLKRCQIKRINEKPVIHGDVNDLDVARMIIKRGVLSLGSIKDDILRVHKEEKKTLHETLSKLSCHFSLLLNFSEDHSFCFLAIYYIDDEWEMRKKILQLSKHEHFYNSYFMETWKTKVLDWNIDKKICSIVCKEEVVNVGSIEIARDSLHFVGQLCPVDYLVKILHSKITTDLLPQPGLSHKLVPAHDYVCKMPLNECNRNVIDKAVSLCSKVIRGWDYEFKNLKVAMELKEVFHQLELLDPNFKTINLSKMEWDEATAQYKCLTELKDAASSFCLSQNQTVNAYFFKVCDFYKKLLLFEESDYQVVREIASDVRKEFVDKIWSNSHLVLAMSVILDPRFKMDTVKHWYKEIYGRDAEKNLKIFIDYVNSVYVKYVGSCSNSSNPDKLLDHLGRPCSKLELDRYLKEPKFPSVEEFDILAWWRINTPNFPILAKMARDFLAIPFAVSDYTMMAEVKYYWVNFDHSRYEDDGILQAIVCTKMWLENP